MIGLARATHSLGTRWRDKTLPRVARVKYAISHVSESVALTFDDGPDSSFTPELLDILNAAGVAATFFVVGRRAVKYPSIVRRIRQEGHVLGSHTWSHPDPGTVSAKMLIHEYRDGRRAVEDVAGTQVPLFRPPMGHVGLKSVTAIRLARVRPWLWNCDPEDWRPGARREVIARAVEAVTPGAVVLLHDGIELPLAAEALDRSETIAAVRQILRTADLHGVRFATLPASGGYGNSRETQRYIR
jgi:peptidoglycan/xylan/chitin deacetylase (PgdA/CDA1 family)